MQREREYKRLTLADFLWIRGLLLVPVDRAACQAVHGLSNNLV